MKRKISWIIIVLCTTHTWAQDFAYKSDVTPVSEKGFHKIVLSPELLGKTNRDHSDIRIYDNQNIEQPYVLNQGEIISTTSLFKEYEIIEKEYKEDAISHLIFHNPEKEAINNVSFIVKNTDVKKRARLSGSDDNENWYVIKNNYLLHSMHSSKKTSELKILNFPLSNYEFFKLEINDNWRLPINILKVGYYDTQKIKGKSTRFNIPVNNQKDSLKTTYIKVVLPDTMYLERLKFYMSGADYYSRYTTISIRKERLTKKKKVRSYFETIGSFDLNSNSTNEIYLGNKMIREFYIEIDNKDNQPLIVDRLEGMYLNKYIVVDLEPSKNYVLKFGDKARSKPHYDITSFTDQIPKNLPKTIHNELVSLKNTKQEIVTEKGIFDNPYILWSVIGLVGIVLSFVSIKMLKEIEKK